MPSNDFSSQTKVGKLHGWNVYVVYELEGLYTKIGTASNVKYRLSSLRNGNPRELRPYAVWRVSSRLEAFTLERTVLARAGAKRVAGRDWVMLSHQITAKLVEAAASELGIPLKEITL